MTQIYSFPPIADTNAKILVLGSMPGQASLAAYRYYAHPQNSFWRIMTELLGMDPAASYDDRVGNLKIARIAVWDVLRSCVREGSLDSNIKRDTQVANDFDGFFQSHSAITHVFFNGAKAEDTYKRYVLREPSGDGLTLQYRRLPSTSPANASFSYARKLEEWRAILPPLADTNL